MFYLNNTNSFQKEARAIFFLCTVLGQISFSLFTKIQGGFLMLPLLEFSTLTKKITQNCMQDNEDGFKNVLMCLFISCLATSFIGFILYLSNATKFLLRIPRNINDSIMITIGIANIVKSFQKVADHESKITCALLILGSIFITAIGISLYSYTRNPFHIFYYLVSLICVLNLIKLLVGAENCIKHKLFIRDNSDPLCLSIVFQNFGSESAKFDFGMIRKNLKYIAIIASTPLISQILSLSVYSKMFDEEFSIPNELFNISLTNIISSLSFFPSHFSCSGSIFYRLAGAKTKYRCLISGLSLILLFYIFHYILPLIPLFSVSFVLQFIGLSTLISYIKILANASNLDRIQLIATCAICFYTHMNIVVVIGFGLLFSYLSSYYLTSQFIDSADIKYQQDNNSVFIKVDGSLNFSNVAKLIEKIKGFKSNIVISLEDCKYVDYTANIELSKFVGNHEFKVEFQGDPSNFNRKIMKL